MGISYALSTETAIDIDDIVVRGSRFLEWLALMVTGKK